jgi:glycosyltransferase involved in cell wall biosynthesis
LAIEVLLQRKTFANIAFWPIESEYFKEMRNSSKTIYAPVMIEKYKNISKSQLRDTNPNSTREKLNLVSIGRLAPQKDPGFFVEVVKELKREIHFESCWYGDGTQFPKKIFHENEIKLRGWQDQQVILEEIKSKRTVAVFSSRWESGPITLFEVLTSGVPVVCRSIEAFQTYGLGDGDSPKDLALQVLELNATQDLSKIATLQLENIWRSLPNSQTLMLERLYMGI